jgi:hypothetical protein
MKYKSVAIFMIWGCLLSVSFTYAQVKGSGTVKTVPVWTGTTTLGDSAISQNNGNIGIGTKTPQNKLTVTGFSAGPLVLVTNASSSQKTIPVGVLAFVSAPHGSALQGNATSTAKGAFGSGVFGYTATEGGNGVIGYATSPCSATLCPVGVHGTVQNGGGAVVAIAANTSGPSNALQAETYSPQAYALSIAAHGGGPIIGAVSGPSSTPLFVVDASGNVTIAGHLSKASGSFKIDHPLDPANKYLSHSFVESPDMMNIYSGLAVLDANGEAWVTMPAYFEALNSEFRYQLTAIGAPGPNLYIAAEISGNRFRVAGGKSGSKVSWQVTGIRHDAYAEAHRIKVEEDKPQQERGHYLHPELFGATEKETVGATSHPAMILPVTAAVTNGAGLR